MVDTYKDRLARAMSESGVSISALASALDISYQAVKKVLNGLSKSFSAENNARAAVRLGVTAHWLATGEEPKHPDRSHAPDPGRHEPIDIAHVMSQLRWQAAQLSASDRRMVASLIASYISDEDASDHQLDAICRLLAPTDGPPRKSRGRAVHEGLSGPGGRITPEGGLVQHPRKGGAQKK